MFSRKFYFIILSLALFSGFLPYHAIEAQDSAEPIIATVTVQNLNIRYAPTNFYWLDEDSTILGQLHQGDVIIVHYYENVSSYNSDPNQPWVYVTHDESNLTGWVHSRYLLFSEANWKNRLPHIDTWRELEQNIAESNHPFPAVVHQNGAPTHLWSEPYYGSTITYTVHPAQPVNVIGSAKINGVVRFVYVEATDGDATGWVANYKISPAVEDYDGRRSWEQGIPVLVERDFRTEFASYPIAVVASNSSSYQYYSLNVRDTPSINGQIIQTLPSGVRLAVHGRTNHETEGWVYITVIDMISFPIMIGLSGWVFDPNWEAPYLRYDNDVPRSSLPIINP